MHTTPPVTLDKQEAITAAEYICRSVPECKVIIKNIPVRLVPAEYIRGEKNEWKAWKRFPGGSEVTLYLLPF